MINMHRDILSGVAGMCMTTMDEAVDELVRDFGGDVRAFCTHILQVAGERRARQFDRFACGETATLNYNADLVRSLEPQVRRGAGL